MILLIDNYDSFTYNLYQQLSRLGGLVQVVKHDAIDPLTARALSPSHIVISPGPGRPQNSGASMAIIKEFYTTTPILGVCLGHQCIGEVFGSRIVAAPQIIHGAAVAIRHSRTGLFQGLPELFIAARYHSLVIDQLPLEFTQTAWSDDGVIMAIEHTRYPTFGVQFHPESFMTTHGDHVIRNFLKCGIT
jgi:anthranilate synthase component 2